MFDIQLQSDCFPLMRQCFQDVIETGELGAFEATGVGALNGRLFMCRVGPILQNDQIESLILIFTDITERKQAEEMVLYSTKMESLGVLAGGVAHDFNNLLVAMLGQSSLALVKLEEESKARTHVEKVMKAAERAAHLTKQMLAYSGKSQFSKKIFNVNDLIQENIELFQAAISKNVRLRPSLHTNLPLIEADINQMQQVIMNLILNAAEAIEHTLGTVNIRTSIDQILGYEKEYWQWTGKPLAPGRYLCIEIRDNGKGMDANTLSKIFDPFFTTKFTGRGLGLAAVIGIIRGHRGGIKVFSTVNEGTTFRLLFPILPHSEIAVVAKDDKVVETAVFQLTNATILVIDDEETILETVSDMLFEIGYQVIIANSGESGLSSYQEKMNQIGIVLLDLSMPGLSGRETFNALRRLNPDVNIILSSGYSQQEVKERYFQNDDEFDYTQFLSKPYEPDTLVNLIHNSLTQDENR
ncbi:MAG: response regulator [Chloroflexi bacterium]|nr:response regulator [Chloroflexota bacterium]